MKTIIKHNKDYLKEHKKKLIENGAGVLCPECKIELYYIDKDAINPLFPPTQTVKCPKCDRFFEKFI